MNQLHFQTSFQRSNPQACRPRATAVGRTIRRWFNAGATCGLLLVARPTPAMDPSVAIAETRKLLASDAGATPNAMFGYSVAIDGDTAVVGARQHAAAYVFGRDVGGPNNWGEVKMLNGLPGSLFGAVVALHGDTLVVTAPRSSITSPILQRFAGATHVFGRNRGGPNNWGEVKALTASDAAANSQFGYSASLEGDTLVVGAAGSAYVLGRNSGGADNWGELQKLTPSDSTTVVDSFAASVAISDENIVVGAYQQNAAYVYNRNTGGADHWGEVTKLTAPANAPVVNFGLSISLSGDTLAVGSLDPDTLVGAAFVFGRNVGGMDNWGAVTTITPVTPLPFESFGASVSLSGNTLVVGAFNRDFYDVGKAYVFGRNTGGGENWGQAGILAPSDGTSEDFFGSSVATDGSSVVVGAVRQNASTGAAYVYVGNAAPIARCHDVTISAGADCLAAASIDNGSYDPDPGDAITLIQSPTGPYPIGRTLVTLTVTDPQGASLSCQATVTVVDDTPPSIHCPGNISATATASTGAFVSFPAPTASDCCSIPRVVCSPASGSAFPLGTSAVTCTATDGTGNQAQCTFSVNVTYSWSGVMPPIKRDASSVFKAGSTVPVSFQLNGASAGIKTALARLSYSKVSNGVPGAVHEADAPGGAKGSDFFKYDAACRNYLFNWSTKGLTAGIYQLQINLGDGVVHLANVTLK